jgi:hypothetical protein
MPLAPSASLLDLPTSINLEAEDIRTGPAVLDARIIDQIKATEARDGFIETAKPRGSQPGDRVQVVEGLLQGQYGVLLQLKAADRIVVLLNFMNSQQRCEMPRAAVVRAEPKRLA